MERWACRGIRRESRFGGLRREPQRVSEVCHGIWTAVAAPASSQSVRDLFGRQIGSPFVPFVSLHALGSAACLTRSLQLTACTRCVGIG